MKGFLASPEHRSVIDVSYYACYGIGGDGSIKIAISRQDNCFNFTSPGLIRILKLEGAAEVAVKEAISGSYTLKLTVYRLPAEVMELSFKRASSNYIRLLPPDEGLGMYCGGDSVGAVIFDLMVEVLEEAGLYEPPIY